MKRKFYFLRMFFAVILMALIQQFTFAQINVGYVTSFDNLTADGASDPIVAMLEADPYINLTVIETNQDDTDGPMDLSMYDVVVAQEAFSSSSTIYQRGQTLGMGTIPVPFILNKVYTMRDGRGFTDGVTGSGGEVEGTLSIAVDPANQSNDLFKGVTFMGDTVQLFKSGGDDNGGDSRTKGLQYAVDVVISEANTLLASGTNDPDNATVCINDIPAGATIGSETLQARMITFGMNYGAMSKNGGSLTSAGLTIWRNAIYSLGGLPVPDADVMVPKSVAYVTQFSNLTGEGASDPIVAMLEKDPKIALTVIETNQDDTEGPMDLSMYDVVVAQEAFSSSSTIYQRDHTLGMGTIPVPFILNKVYTMRDGRGFTDGAAGSGGEVEGTFSIAVDPANQSNELFNGITFAGDTVQLFKSGGDDNGGDTRTKGMQYAVDVVISEANTLLASGTNDPDNATVCINDIPAGATIGSETLQARMITFAMNYGAMSKNGGDLTDAGLTLWRNAIYSLAGLPIPATGVIAPRKLAYVTQFTNLTGEGASDPLVAMFDRDPNIALTVIETNQDDTDGPIDLSMYDAVVAQEAFSSSSTIYQRDHTLGMGTIPVPFILNKVYTMRDGRGFTDGAAGSGGEVEGTFSIAVDPANQSNDLFKGITFMGDTVQIFKSGGDDNGGDTRTKGLQYAVDVVISEANTLLASGTNDPDNATVCINDIPAGATIGSETLQARMIAVGMNYGAISKNGNDLTDAGLTIWRNAVYSLTGLPIPDTKVEGPRNVAYVTTFDNLTADGASDPLVKLFNADPLINLTVIETNQDDTEGPMDLSMYDAVVAQEAFSSSSTIYQRDHTLGMGTIPVPFILNKVYTMRDGRGFTDGAAGSGGEVEGTRYIDVDPANQANELFNGFIFNGDSAQIFMSGGDDNGGDSRTKGLQYAVDVVISEANTLLASGVNDPDNATVCVNDIPAGATIGSETLQARMIAVGMNYGAMSKNGNDLTTNGLTLWRNAVYSLAGLTVPTTPAVMPTTDATDAYWKFDEGSGTSVSDEYGIAGGTLMNGTDTTWVTGYVGGGLNFSNGVADSVVYVHVPNGPTVDKDSTQSFSVSVIVKGDITVSSEQSIFAKGIPYADNGGWYHLSFKDQALRFMIWDDATETMTSPAGVLPDAFPADDWVHVVCVRDREAQMARVYLNGILLDEAIDNTVNDIATDGDFYIGAIPPWGTQYYGSIDELMVVDRALTADEISTMAQDYGFSPIVDPSDDCTLSALSVDGATLDPTFDPATTAYSITVEEGSTVTITATANDDGASITGAGAFDITGIAVGSSGDATITVTAEDGTQCTYTITVNVVTGVEADKLDMIKVYPSPAKSSVTVTNVSSAKISIYAANGTLVRSVDASSDNEHINVSDLNAGVYIMKIQLDSNVKVARFIKE